MGSVFGSYMCACIWACFCIVLILMPLQSLYLILSLQCTTILCNFYSKNLLLHITKFPKECANLNNKLSWIDALECSMLFYFRNFRLVNRFFIYICIHFKKRKITQKSSQMYAIKMAKLVQMHIKLLFIVCGMSRRVYRCGKVHIYAYICVGMP